jgi:hypothetical protein
MQILNSRFVGFASVGPLFASPLFEPTPDRRFCSRVPPARPDAYKQAFALDMPIGAPLI